MRIQITLQEIVLVTAGDFDTEWHGIEIICDDKYGVNLYQVNSLYIAGL